MNTPVGNITGAPRANLATAQVGMEESGQTFMLCYIAAGSRGVHGGQAMLIEMGVCNDCDRNVCRVGVGSCRILRSDVMIDR